MRRSLQALYWRLLGGAPIRILPASKGAEGQAVRLQVALFPPIVQKRSHYPLRFRKMLSAGGPLARARKVGCVSGLNATANRPIRCAMLDQPGRWLEFRVRR